MTSYDAIVIGSGGVGSAALYHLARRGARVLGLDQFPPGHDRGSSHGQTRAIRQAYFEHPNYVPLLRRAYQLWEELEDRTAEKLYHEIGLLEVGPRDGIVVPGVLRSAQQYDLQVDELSRSEVTRRLPGFVVPDDFAAVFEREAGYLSVEACVLAHLDAARDIGAELQTGQAVRGWSARGDAVEVQTSDTTFTAGRLVIAAGAWAARLLVDLAIPLRVLRKHLHWYPGGDVYRQDAGCPVFFFELRDGFFYGFPDIDGGGVKLGEHSGGEEVDDPLDVDRGVDLSDRQRVERFLARCMPQVTRKAADHAVCMYTMTPDEHFIVDRHPDHATVALAAGLSGHGFKFAGVIGWALAELVLDGSSTLPIEFLACDRPELK